MRILIVEDDPSSALWAKTACEEILGSRIEAIAVLNNLKAAAAHINHSSVDLCLLDLNLQGESGFDLFKNIIDNSFQTIIVSAYQEKAVEAFNHRILDFVPKPLDIKRLEVALHRFFEKESYTKQSANYLTIRKSNKNYILKIEEVLYFKSDGYLVNVHCKNGTVELIDESLNKLEKILPSRFIRTHRSCIIDKNEINSYYHEHGGIYKIELRSGEILPLNRSFYKTLRYSPCNN